MLRSRQWAILIFFWMLPAGAFAQDVDTITVKHAAATWDEKALVAINHFGDSLGIDKDIIFFTNTAFITCVAFPTGIYALGIAKHDREQAIAGLTIGVGLGVSSLVTEGIKAIVQRSRPFHDLLGVRTPSAGAGGYSFPSGHSTAVWSLATGLTLQYPKWYVITPAVLYATAVSLSRPYLGVHYLSDLIAGAIVGISCSYAVYKLESPLTKLLAPILPNASPASVSASRAMVRTHSFGISISGGELHPVVY